MCVYVYVCVCVCVCSGLNPSLWRGVSQLISSPSLPLHRLATSYLWPWDICDPNHNDSTHKGKFPWYHRLPLTLTSSDPIKDKESFQILPSLRSLFAVNLAKLCGESVMQSPGQINVIIQHCPQKFPSPHSSEEWRLPWEREANPEVKSFLDLQASACLRPSCVREWSKPENRVK